MINRFANLTSRLAALFAIVIALAACGGGGGGGGGGSFLPEDGGDQPENGSYFVTLELTDANGNPTGTLSSTQPANLTVTVTTRGSNKKPIEGAVVTAETDTATLAPANGSALTNVDGIALLQLLAGDTQGAGIVTVTVESPDGPTVEEIGFQVTQAGLQIGSFQNGSFVPGAIDLNLTDLVAGGSARIRVSVVDENGQLTESVEQVRFASSCSVSGLAGFSSAAAPETVSRLTADTVDGTAEVIYEADGCVGQDEVTATLLSTSGTATGTITVEEGSADFIGWTTTSPINEDESTLIALRGTGSGTRLEEATVTFQVCSVPPTDALPCEPLSGAKVNFELSNTLGGVMLESTSGSTDLNGEVDAIVQAGNVATSVFVTATIESSGAGNTSNVIVVSTGLPDQNSISFQPGDSGPGCTDPDTGEAVPGAKNITGALEFDGKKTCLTVRLADKFNNPVADGTSAVFTTEYGSIQPSCVTTAGVCRVIWTSQSPSPRLPVFNQELVKTVERSNSYSCRSEPNQEGHNGDGGACPNDLGPIRGLRSTVLVTVPGEEYFVDSNANGLYDEGEPFENLPEAWIDHNEDGVYTPALGPGKKCTDEGWAPELCAAAGAEEEFVDFNGDGDYNLNVDSVTGEGIYNGSLCPEEGEELGYCSRELVSTRASIVLVMSSQNDFEVTLVEELSARVVSSVTEDRKYLAYIADLYNNRPGADSEITLSGGCTLKTESSFIVPDSNERGAFTIPIEVEGDGDSGSIAVKVNGITTKNIACFTEPDDPNALVIGGGGGS